MIKILNLKHVISIKDFKKEDILYILEEASKLENIAKSKETSTELAGKILGLMFFEPSTRTKLSFETSMKRLGGECISIQSGDSSSVAKGESLADTSKMFESYCDAIVIRHDLEGVSRFLSETINIPIINAGDGAGQHPTQTLLDLYTIQKEFGKIDGLKVALIGDLKYGRTVHSLVYALGLFDVEITLISPDELKMPENVIHDLEEKNIKIQEKNEIKDIIDNIDILYVTRIQKERFPDYETYLNVKGAYVINKKMLEGKNLIVMHPLPRIDEVSTDVDDTKYNKYFQQAFNAVPVRMAILKNIIKNNEKELSY